MNKVTEATRNTKNVTWPPAAVAPNAIARAIRELAAESEHRQKIAAFEASTRQLRGGLDAVESAHVRLDVIAARMAVVARLSTQTRRAA